MICERRVIIFCLFLAVSKERERVLISIFISGLVTRSSKSLPSPGVSVVIGVSQESADPKRFGTSVQSTDRLLASLDTIMGCP